jgi:hypothetical protein
MQNNWGQSVLFNKWYYDNWIFTGKTNKQTEEIGHQPYIEFNSKWIISLNVRAKIVSHLVESTGLNLHDLGLGNG